MNIRRNYLWKCFEEQWRSINTSDLLQWSLFSMLLTPPLKTWGFPGGTSGKESACQCRRCKRGGFNPWVGKSARRGGHSNPLQFSCLGNPMDRGTWQATVHRVAKSRTPLKQLSPRSHRNGLILVTVPDCKWPHESAGSGVPDERAYLHRLRSCHHPNHWQSEGAERPQRHPNTLGLESGWRFHSPVLSSPPILVVVCFSFFLATCPYLLRWMTADTLPDGVWWRHMSMSSAPRLGWGADHRETIALIGGQDCRADDGERWGACVQLLLMLILYRTMAWLVELGDWHWYSASNCWTYLNFITWTTGVPFLCQDPMLQSGSFASNWSLYSMVLW